MEVFEGIASTAVSGNFVTETGSETFTSDFNVAMGRTDSSASKTTAIQGIGFNGIQDNSFGVYGGYLYTTTSITGYTGDIPNNSGRVLVIESTAATDNGQADIWVELGDGDGLRDDFPADFWCDMWIMEADGANYAQLDMGRIKWLYPTWNKLDPQTVTITRSGTTATVNETGHQMYGSLGGITISGANETEYNGISIICTNVVDENNWQYEVSGSPATPATGTITSSVKDYPTNPLWLFEYGLDAENPSSVCSATTTSEGQQAYIRDWVQQPTLDGSLDCGGYGGGVLGGAGATNGGGVGAHQKLLVPGEFTLTRVHIDLTSGNMEVWMRGLDQSFIKTHEYLNGSTPTGFTWTPPLTVGPRKIRMPVSLPGNVQSADYNDGFMFISYIAIAGSQANLPSYSR